MRICYWFAADDYSLNVKEDIIQGYEDGGASRRLECNKSRGAYVKAITFGKMPELNSTQNVWQYKEDFTDMPKWAETELADVFVQSIGRNF